MVGVVPYTRNNIFVERVQLFEVFLVVTMMDHMSNSHSKSQIALEYAHRLRKESPEVSIFWVHAGSADKFRQGYDAIAKEVQIPGSSDPSAFILGLVKAWLTEKQSGLCCGIAGC
jgi:hypothetical protein